MQSLLPLLSLGQRGKPVVMDLLKAAALLLEKQSGAPDVPNLNLQSLHMTMRHVRQRKIPPLN